MQRQLITNTQDNSKMLWYKFKNTDDILQQASKECPHKDMLAYRSSKVANTSFTETENFDHACNLFRFGWPAGFKQAMEIYNQYQDIFVEFFPRQDYITTQVYDTEGAYVDIEKFIEHEPECMISSQVSKDESKLTIGNSMQRFIIYAEYTCAVDSETIFNNGALLICLFKAMQLHGFQVEILARCTSTNNDKDIFVMDFNLKSFEEHLDFNKIAFVLAHPSYVRRITFAIMENEPDYKLTRSFGTFYDYGQPKVLVKNLLPTDFLFKPLLKNETFEQTLSKFKSLIKDHFQTTTVNE